MKNWLGAAGRLCADFFLVLLILVAIAALGQSPDEATAGFIVAAALAQAFRLFPLAAAAAIFLGSYAFERRTRRRFVALSSALILGFGLLTGASILRRQDLVPVSHLAKPRPEAASIVENGRRALFVGRFEGGSAVNVLGYEGAKDDMPRLFYASRAAYDFGGDRVSVAGRSFRALTGGGASPAPHFPRIPGLEARDLDERLGGLDALPPSQALLVLGGFALLAAGLSGFARLPRWPLAGFFFAIAGLVALFLLDSALGSPPIQTVIHRAGTWLHLSLPPRQLLVAAIEAFLGLLLGLLFLLSRREAEE